MIGVGIFLDLRAVGYELILEGDPSLRGLPFKTSRGPLGCFRLNGRGIQLIISKGDSHAD